MTPRRRTARILAGLVLTASTVLCAFVRNDTEPPPEPVTYICTPTKPRCIAAMTEAGR